MDSTRKYWHLTTALMVSASLVLSACQETSRKASVRAAGKGTGAQVTESVAKKTEVAKKYSKNIKDPRNLTAYNSHLSELFKALEKSGQVPWSGLFSLKNWIFGGVDLKTISNFISEEYEVRHQQAVVRQTQFEVFVDDKAFVTIASEEQAKLILRQYLTSLYSLRNLSGQELCTLAKQSLNNTECQALAQTPTPEQAAAARIEASKSKSKSDTTVAKTAPSVSRKMERADENRVDRVLALITQKGVQLTEADLLKELTDAGFDMRLFSFKLGKASEVANPKKLTDAQAEALFKAVMQLHGQESTCFSLRSDSNSKCLVNVERSDVFKIPGHAGYRLISLAVKEAEAESSLLTEVFYEMNGQDVVEVMNSKNEKLQLLPLVSKGLEKPEVGTKYRLNYLVLKKVEAEGKTDFGLSGVLSIPGVLKKVTVVDGKTACEGALAEGKEKAQDIILIASDDKLVSSLKEVTAKSQPTAPCW
ncbi:hypothetical protein ACLWBD_15965 [Bdellovibrio sp. HCB117]|uniref:hypothetical protein n=1 Tax=Bdellovibrio sp. HCB117 TaxID=3394359 RepID=UPI0039B6D88F